MKAVLTFSLIFMFLLACSSKTVKEDEVKKTILRYNTLLAKGYSELNMTPLKEVATEMQAEKEYIHMAALGEAGVRMEAELMKLEFKEITFPDRNHAVVKTMEVWDYKHIGIKDMKIKKEEKDVRYDLIYKLQRGDSSWVVTSVDLGA